MCTLPFDAALLLIIYEAVTYQLRVSLPVSPSLPNNECICRNMLRVPWVAWNTNIRDYSYYDFVTLWLGRFVDRYILQYVYTVTSVSFLCIQSKCIDFKKYLWIFHESISIFCRLYLSVNKIIRLPFCESAQLLKERYFATVRIYLLGCMHSWNSLEKCNKDRATIVRSCLYTTQIPLRPHPAFLEPCGC